MSRLRPPQSPRQAALTERFDQARAFLRRRHFLPCRKLRPFRCRRNQPTHHRKGRYQDHREIAVVAIKQLYASHYFHTALDISVCLNDDASRTPRGFYLVTLKGSQQAGLTGVKGSTMRHVVVDKTRSSLEAGLTSIKQTLEQRTGR